VVVSILFTATQFTIVVTFLLFAFFFHHGYTSKKKSGGFFLLFAGFSFLGFNAVASSLFGVIITVFMSPFALLIIILGIIKTFYTDEKTLKGE